MVPKTLHRKVFFKPCFQLLQKKNKCRQIEKKKSSKFIFGEKEWEKISTIRKTVIHDAENLGLVPVLEPFSDKNSTMEHELANCHAVYDVAIHKKRRVSITIKKYYEVLKQFVYVNYTLNDFKELAQVLGDFTFVENCNVQ